MTDITQSLDDEPQLSLSEKHADRFGWVVAEQGLGNYPNGWTCVIDAEAGGIIAAFGSQSAAVSYYEWLKTRAANGEI